MKKSLYLIFCLLLTAGISSAADFRIIGAEELKKMMDSKKAVSVIDTRTEAEYAEGHIPGSKNIPPEKVSNISALLPKAKAASVVFYCRGVG